MKRVNFVSLDFLTLQWFCNTLQTQHPQTQAAKELYDALEALYAGKSDSLMLELGEAIPEAASTSLVCGNLLIDSKSRRVIRDGARSSLLPKSLTSSISWPGIVERCLQKSRSIRRFGRRNTILRTVILWPLYAN